MPIARTFTAGAAAMACIFSALTANAQPVPELPDPENGDTIVDIPPPPPPVERALPSIVTILAHPDDEITIAPVLARAARSGSEVTLVFATSGGADPGVSGMKPGKALAGRRENEARCAAFALGLPEPLFWRLGDNTLGNAPRAPDSPARRAAAKVVELIGEKQPTVIMTFGPDGGYGHVDHRMVSAVVTQAVQAMAAPRPDLIYSALPSAAPDYLSQFETPIFEHWARTDPSLITDRLRYDLFDLQAAENAISCYETRFDEEARNSLAGLLDRSVWRGAVHFRLAFPSVITAQ